MNTIPAKNQFAITLAEKEREYRRLFDQRIWTAADVKRLEDLNRNIQFLRILSGAQNAR